MPDLKIRLFNGKETDPTTTVSIPLDVLAMASKLIPAHIVNVLDEKGIHINQILELSQKNVQGTLLEIEEHKKQEKIVLSIE